MATNETPVEKPVPANPPTSQVRLIDIRVIDPNPFQHRQTMDEVKMEELMSAIVAQGLLQPVQVRPTGERYQLIFGHRRKEAFSRLHARAQDPKWLQIPAISKVGVTDQQMQLHNLAENLNREDPPVVEVAAGVAEYQRIRNLTVEQLATELGQKEVRVKRLLRLNQAPGILKAACSEGWLMDDDETKGHTKERRRLDLMACLELTKLYKYFQAEDAFSAEGKLGAVVERALKEGWSLRHIEEVVVRTMKGESAEEAASAEDKPRLFKVSSKQLTFFRDLANASPAEKLEAKTLFTQWIGERA